MPGAGMAVELASVSPLNYHSVEFIDFDENETQQNYFFINAQKLQFPIDKLKGRQKNLRTFSFWPELFEAWFAPTRLSANYHRNVQVSIQYFFSRHSGFPFILITNILFNLIKVISFLSNQLRPLVQLSSNKTCTQ